MKAIYQQPTTIVVVLQTQRMIAQSQLKDLVEEGEDLDNAPETTATYGNLSRRHRSVWDDDEEEYLDY